MTISETPPVSLLKPPMSNLDSPKMCLPLFTSFGSWAHFDVLLTTDSLIYYAMYLISIIYYSNVGKHWGRSWWMLHTESIIMCISKQIVYVKKGAKCENV